MISQWVSLILAIAVIAVAAFLLISIKRKPSSVDLTKIQQWLVWAVLEAEKTFGGKMGEIKLRYVYDLFVSKFPSFAKDIDFDSFRKMVDIALQKLNQLLSVNEKLQKYITGDNKEEID